MAKPSSIYVLLISELPNEIVFSFNHVSLKLGLKIVVPEIGHPEKDNYLSCGNLLETIYLILSYVKLGWPD